MYTKYMQNNDNQYHVSKPNLVDNTQSASQLKLNNKLRIY